MKFETTREDLLKSLGKLKNCVARRTTIPILANFLIECDRDGVTFRASDLDKEMRTPLVTSHIANEGRITVSHERLFLYVSKLPHGAAVRIELKESVLHVSSGRSRSQLQTLDGADFPDLTTGELPCRFLIAAEDLSGLLGRVEFAMSTEETRYYLNGIYLHIADVDGKKYLRAAATDGHRLGRTQIDVPDGAGNMPGIILPRSAMKDIIDMCAPGQMIEVGVSNTKIELICGESRLVSKLIDGTFPDYERVIPKGNNRIAEVSSADLAAMVDRVATIGTERGRAVKFSFDSGKLRLTVTSVDAGTAEDEGEVDYDADPMEIGFNHTYVGDILQEIDGDRARIHLADAGSPTLFTRPDDEATLYVLMPMRV